MLTGQTSFDAVFISDLHLHPDNPVITERFNNCIDWLASNCRALYILGDFFHAWPGDDGFDAWSLKIAARLKWLSSKGIPIYFMVGNRDFLVGDRFARESGVTILKEPTVIHFDEIPVLLVHGDRYCIKDKAHQWFRKLTRNRFFPKIFLKIPFKLRNKMVNQVRQISQSGQYKPELMDVVPEVMLAHMQYYKATTLIHGHTHKYGLTKHLHNGINFNQYILSDWDDSPQLLCYHNSKGFQFVQFS